MAEPLAKQPDETPAPAGNTPEIESQFILGLRRFGLCHPIKEPGTVTPERPLRYAFQGELGRGGMGVVFKAVDLDLQRPLAMKVVGGNPRPHGEDPGDLTVDPVLLRRFLEEAQVTGQLDHPGIVPLHEVGIDPRGRLYFTMRLVRGQHLGEVIAQVRAGSAEWTLERALTVLVKTCEAMAYAHDKGVIHRDLKPANVMTGRFGEVYVMDWGLARARDRSTHITVPFDASHTAPVRVRQPEAENDAQVTIDGSVFGTPVNMAPEQARGEVGRIDRRSDVYSLGAILYQLLTGSAPYLTPELRVSASTVLRWVIEGPPRRVREIDPRAPADLTAICERCMARDPDERYPDMLSVEEDLRRYLRGTPVSANPLSRPVRALRWCRRNPMVAGFLLALTLGAAIGFATLSQLTTTLVRQTALDSAAREARMLEDVNGFYSAEVVNHVDRSVVPVTHDYASVPGAIPIPATFLTKFAEHVTASGSGNIVRHYSEYPFRFRQGGPRDEFAVAALASLTANPETPFIRLESVDGVASLRYAAARRMQQSCVDCHNSHPDSPRHDWKVGDVRGVLEIVRPLDQDVARTRRGLAGIFTLVGVVGTGLMLVSAFLLVRQSRPRS